jgi:hypothetical protein
MRIGGQTKRDARNLVKIVQIDLGEQERWWLVYAYPFVVDAFVNKILHHADVTIAGDFSTDALVDQGKLPWAYGANQLHIPKAHVLVLYTSTKHNTQRDWDSSFGAPSDDTLFQRWISPVLQAGVRLRNISAIIMSRPTPHKIRSWFGMHREHYAVWSQPCREDSDDCDDDDGIWGPSFDPSPKPEFSDLTQLVSSSEFNRRKRGLCRLYRRMDREGTDSVAAGELDIAETAFFSCAAVPRAGHCIYLNSAYDPRDGDLFFQSRLRQGRTLLKYIALAPPAAVALP